MSCGIKISSNLPFFVSAPKNNIGGRRLDNHHHHTPTHDIQRRKAMDHSYLLTLCNQSTEIPTSPQNFANTVRLNPALILTLYCVLNKDSILRFSGEQKLFGRYMKQAKQILLL